MKEVLKGYEIVNTIIKERHKLLGISEEQLDSFEYQEKIRGIKYSSTIHVSHFILGVYLIVYNKSYILKPEEVVYLLNDLGGNWNNERK